MTLSNNRSHESAPVAASLPIERFQNETLRPLLKQQNDVLVGLYRHFLRKRRVPFLQLPQERRTAWISESLSKDNRLRGLVLGMVIGHLSVDQLAFYLEEEGEINRRIIALATQRLQSQLEQLL